METDPFGKNLSLVSHWHALDTTDSCTPACIRTVRLEPCAYLLGYQPRILLHDNTVNCLCPHCRGEGQYMVVQLFFLQQGECSSLLCSARAAPVKLFALKANFSSIPLSQKLKRILYFSCRALSKTTAEEEEVSSRVCTEHRLVFCRQHCIIFFM